MIDGIEVYPEYLTDMAVMICPSSSGAGPVEESFDAADNLAAVVVSNAYTDKFDTPITAPTSGVPNTDLYACELDTSASAYIYLAWMTTLVGVTDGPQVDFTGVTDMLSAATAMYLGGWGDVVLLMGGLRNVMADASIAPGAEPGDDPGARNGDFTVPNTGFPFPTSSGDDLEGLRLREGIERYLITDINNPAGSSRAQSEIWVAADSVDLFPDEFNHVPGGANVLYMDGHVEFIRYPGEWPVHSVFAALNYQVWFG
ncbi:MAG: hypothetical protein KJ060_12125 [Candidatus Hydrogenedentes bacterium]|nr:hypothetical protein [Candidatus Hydrogenedentota bacterium]